MLFLLLCSETSGADHQFVRDPQFIRDIVPLFKARCIKCHGPAKQEGELDLSTAVGVAYGGESGAAVEPGSLDASSIWMQIQTHEMPPDEPLSEQEQSLIRIWISQGTEGIPTRDELGMSPSEHWSFRQMQKVDVPLVVDDASCRTDVDRFLQDALEARGLGLGPEADRSTLIRRVSFDLTGLPPTLDEISAYLSDSSDIAYEQMVQRYLASPRYGERWGKYWLDIAGYADSNGYFDSDSDRPLAYRYRDYVIRSINADKPFDQFIREQLAGDELVEMLAAGESPEKKIELMEATHFLRNAQDGTGESDGNPDEVLMDRRAVLDGTVEILGSALFGLTLQCAKCHDHKFEPVTQQDYYGLQAVLAPAFDLQNWQPPNQRDVWEKDFYPTVAAGATTLPGKVVPSTRPLKIAAVRDVSSVAPDVFILQRGEHTMPGARVLPSGLGILNDSQNLFTIQAPSPSSNSTGNRLALAKWLTHPGGRPAALLARLQVNRIWQQYFSVGLVATPANLGLSGDPPSHPQLLEWLAGRFVDSGWSSKEIHRLILESAVYRQSSAMNAVAYHSDPDNRLLWRMPLRRLDAESMYDAMLAVSGDIDLSVGGPAIPTVLVNVGEVSVADDDPGGFRRAVYLKQRRTQIPTLLRIFDAPSLVTNCVERPPSTIPLQSLALLNSDFVLTRASNLAKRLALEAGLESDERVVQAFLLTLAREPDVEELRSSLLFIRNQTRQYLKESPVPQRRAWADFCHSMIASNAFLYLD